jgi:hypothetical protein
MGTTKLPLMPTTDVTDQRPKKSLNAALTWGSLIPISWCTDSTERRFSLSDGRSLSVQSTGTGRWSPPNRSS